MTNLWLYKKLFSVYTSLLLLGFLTFFSIIGTIFPQEAKIEDYKQAGGRMIWLVEKLQLLELFTSPWFLILSFLFFLNLFLCSLERLRSYIKSPNPPTPPFPKGGKSGFSASFALPRGMNVLSLEKVFKELGFRTRKAETKGELHQGIATKGLPVHWLSLGYHLAIFICFLGFSMTYLFAKEGYITLYPGDKAALSTLRTESRWNYFLRGWGVKRSGLSSLEGISLMLEEFFTEYYQIPSFDYPKSALSRLAHALGWSQGGLKYDLNKKSLYPKDWKSHLAIVKDGNIMKRKIIEVNTPLRYKGLTFYQMGYEQRLDLGIDGKILPLKTMESFKIPGMDGKFQLDSLRLGMAYNRDGSTEKIVPYVELTQLSDTRANSKGKALGNIQQGKSFTFSGHEFTIKNIKEATVLSYRYDPGASLLWFSSLCLMFLMALRLWGYSYRIRYFLEERNGSVFFHFKIKGIWASEEKLLERIMWKMENLEEG